MYKSQIRHLYAKLSLLQEKTLSKEEMAPLKALIIAHKVKLA